MVDNLVDDSTAGGSLSDIENDLKAASASRSAPNDKSTKGKQTVTTDEVDDEVLPAKLRGKSKREMAEMYQNLESTYGRMANDLGVQRKLTDVVLGLKREDDLSKNGGSKKVTIKSDELLENPTEALERFQAPRDAENEQRIQRLETQLKAQAFVAQHSDYESIGKDPKFAEWIAQSPTRVRAAQSAQAGDWGSASDLLTEFKAQRDANTTDDEELEAEEVEEKPLEKARKAGLESSSQGSSGARKVGKIFKRADLMKLHVERPDVYYSEDMQAEIVAAYAEGRVK